MARKILLADDSVTAQNMGRKILADAGYEVITVNNGSAALKKIAEHKPDVIILDVYMPGYSGLEVCQRLKDAQETARVPVLLTVGKLEPFKPEESKRVRADGFIVKPFEASELLSALSKLEDKIVPRAEASKPGRFARVTAAIEEGRYDRTVAIDGDMGWKDRISFPPKKKEKSAEEDGNSAAAHGVGGNKLAEKPRPAKKEEPRVDLGALAPEGLPKDVTPEEIAALAAAAAQVKGKIAESSFSEPAPLMPPAEVISSVETQNSSNEHEPQPTAPSQEFAAVEPSLASIEQKFEEKFLETPVEKSAEKIEEKVNAPEEKSGQTVETAVLAAPAPSDVIAAIVGLNPDADASASTTSGNGFSSESASNPIESEPVTMAVTASAGPRDDTPRWTAVSVALGPEDSAISLEHEMQKAYAAFAAAENGHAVSVAAIPESRISTTDPAAEASSTPEVALSETVLPIPALPAPEAAQPLSALATGSTEAIRAAVQEMEMVAESYVAETAPAAPAPEASASVSHAEAATESAPALPHVMEASAPTSLAAEPQLETGKLDAAKQNEFGSSQEGPENRELKNESPASPVSQDRTNEEPKTEEPKDQGQQETRPNDEPLVAAIAAAPPEEKHETIEERQEVAAPAFVNEIPAEQVPVSQISSSSVEATGSEPTANSIGEMSTKHFQESENTAAAWASWRRIREADISSTTSDAPIDKQESSVPPDAAAMAVAAGAEKTPEDASAKSESDSADIANIVDSVLADLRPKIFEEISRKMGKKK